MSFLQMSMGAVTPALADIAMAFPAASSTSIALLTSIPTLFSIPCSILTGKIVGRFIKYKTLAVLGILIILVSGVLPYFAGSLALIIVLRAFLGLGLGLIAPLSPSITMNTLPRQEAERQLGRNGIAANGGAIIFQLLGGFASSIAWRLGFMTYFLALPMLLIVIICLDEPVIISENQTPERAKMNRTKLGKNLWFWGFLNGLFFILFYTMINDLSGVIAKNNMGNASSSAVAFSLFSIGGVLGGFLFSKVVSKIQKLIISLGSIFCSIGFLTLAIGKNIGILYIGTTLFGIGFGMFVPAVTLYAGLSVSPENRPFAVSFLQIFSGVGTFSSAYIFASLRILFNGAGDRFALGVSSCIYGLIAVAFLVYLLIIKYKEESVRA